jgi:hypothetical protein
MTDGAELTDTFAAARADRRRTGRVVIVTGSASGIDRAA